MSEQNPVVVRPLEIAINPALKVEFGGVVSENGEQQVQLIRNAIKNKVLRQFNIAEVANTPVIGGGVFMGNLRVRTSMRLPKVKTRPDGGFAETLREYYNRAMPEIKTWLNQSVQNAELTEEIIAGL